MTTPMTVDDTTWRFVQMLAEVLEHEPRIDLDAHEGHALAESALNHYEWQRQVNALRLLIGVRLTDRAINQLQDNQHYESAADRFEQALPKEE